MLRPYEKNGVRGIKHTQNMILNMLLMINKHGNITASVYWDDVGVSG
jgi:hypothetical protein